MIKLQAHRGVSAECPENTMPAFITAIEQGYEAIEVDVMSTKDNQLVLHHDKTINRTARKADGSPVGAALPLSWLTYDELLEYDGIEFKIVSCDDKMINTVIVRNIREEIEKK